MKPCHKCGIEQPYSEFHHRKDTRDGWSYKCKTCQAAYRKVYYEANREVFSERTRLWISNHPERAKFIAHRSHIKRTYGLTLEEYDRLRLRDDGRCHLCGIVDGTGVDHNHETGIVRGWLCKACNTGLGLFRDSPDMLRRALGYMEQSDPFTERPAS